MKGLTHYKLEILGDILTGLDINVSPEIITVTIIDDDNNIYTFSAPNESEREYVLKEDAEKNIDVAKALRALAYKLETGEPIEVI